MTSIQVHVKAKDLAAFRRRVLYNYRKKPKHEYIEAIFLRKDRDELFVEKFRKVKILSSSPYEVEYGPHEMSRLRKEARSVGLYLGTIHTHTICDLSPSVEDYKGAVEDGEVVIGICGVDINSKGRLRTTLAFWKPQLPHKVNSVTD